MTTAEERELPEGDRPEHALLEAVVELEDAGRQRQRGQDPPAEVAHREQPDGDRTATTTSPIAKTTWIAGGRPSRKLQ